jgi:hypothetical protein
VDKKEIWGDNPKRVVHYVGKIENTIFGKFCTDQPRLVHQLFGGVTSLKNHLYRGFTVIQTDKTDNC